MLNTGEATAEEQTEELEVPLLDKGTYKAIETLEYLDSQALHSGTDVRRELRVNLGLELICRFNDHVLGTKLGKKQLAATQAFLTEYMGLIFSYEELLEIKDRFLTAVLRDEVVMVANE